jgi:heme peroxidase
MARHHGFRTRGLSRGLAAVPQGPVFEGRFGRMFREQPVFDVDDEDLKALADSMSLQRSEDNHSIPAGFTYLGQFVDHDITFDPNSSLQKANDPEGLVNFRNPRFDLDSLYGRGRDDSPYLYDQNSPNDVKLLVGRVIKDQGERVEGQHDLPRNEQERALIGDHRNDENIFVSQLHLLFIKFHNRVVDKVMSDRPDLEDDDLFKEVQRIVRWHYQWVVICDFLRRTIPGYMLDKLLIRDEDGLRKVNLKFYRPQRQPFMPVEFSAAAYRFGHSQVRGGYALNRLVTNPTFRTADDLAQIESEGKDPRTADFRGFRRLPECWTISWPFFFELPGGQQIEVAGRPEPEKVPQPSLNIDTNIAGPLASALPDTDHTNEDDRSLPRRNLLRGKSFRLPSGQWVANAMGLPNEMILSGDDLELEGNLKTKFGVNTPLWYYVLKEAEVQQDGKRLGEVGGRIVAEVLLGLLHHDPLSFLSVQPNWTPELAEDDGQFTMADLIRFADPAAAATEGHFGAPHDPQGDCVPEPEESGQV